MSVSVSCMRATINGCLNACFFVKSLCLWQPVCNGVRVHPASNIGRLTAAFTSGQLQVPPLESACRHLATPDGQVVLPDAGSLSLPVADS